MSEIEIVKKSLVRKVGNESEASYSKLPPNDLDLEKSVLGAIMIESDAIHSVINIITSDKFFYNDRNKKVWTAIKSLYHKDAPIDIVTVFETMKALHPKYAQELAVYISSLTNEIGSAANIETHALFLKEIYVRRRFIELTTEYEIKGYKTDNDIFDTYDSLLTDLNGMNEEINRSQHKPFSEIIREKIIHLKEAATNHTYLTGASTGLSELDRVTLGLQSTDLIIVAGRPSMGKTAFAIDVARKQAARGISVGIFSLEMSASQLTDRIISAETNVPLSNVRKGGLKFTEWQTFDNAMKHVEQFPIQICDKGGLSINEICSIAKNWKLKYSIEAVYVDYIQLISGTATKNSSREQEISGITRRLKQLAKELHVPVVALSQLSRKCEERGDKRPMLSDLRECLSVETSNIYTSKGFLRNSNSPINLLSLSANKKIANMGSVNIPKGSNTVFRLKLNSGRFIDCTLEHPVLTTDGYKKLKDIKQDDSVACAVNFKTDSGNYYNESRFIGWMLGNGCMYGYNVPSFITNDHIIADEFCQYIKTKFGFPPKPHKHYKSLVYQYDITKDSVRTSEGNPVTNWLKEKDLWGRKANGKYIPEWFMQNADTKSICELLAGLWETDGSIAIGKKDVICYATTSDILLKQIVYLLAKIGVFAHFDDGYFSDKATCNCYKISIASSDFKRVFSENIKLAGAKGIKQRGLKLTSRQSYHQNRLGRETTLEIEKTIADSKQKGIRIGAHGGRRLTKESLSKICLKSKIISDKFGWLTTKNIVWDSVDSITLIGEVDIFDRSVPKTNNFIVNGIIVHNSGAIEQDADIVIFPYRDEYYNDNAEKGLCELIIGKNRNGETGKVECMFNAECQKFTNKEWN